LLMANDQESDQWHEYKNEVEVMSHFVVN
jgi:hypothetical protein